MFAIILNMSIESKVTTCKVTTCNKVEENFKKYLDHAKLEHKTYQYEGVQWIVNNETKADPVCSVRGGFIADEMGLGKTIMLIGAMLCNFQERTLIVVPPVLVDQWFVQIRRTTGHRALIYHGNNKKFMDYEMLNNAKIVITTYGAVTMTKKQIQEGSTTTLLHKIDWSRIVFDEAHHLRNSNTTRYASVKMLNAQIRWLVSGTPIQNTKKDFYSLCSLLRLPASFYTDSDNLRALARAFILKRTKKQVGLTMTDVNITNTIVEWSSKKEMELSRLIHSALSFSRVTLDKPDLSIHSVGHLALIQRAKQSCIYPRLLSRKMGNPLNGDAFEGRSKIDAVVQKMLERKDNGCGKLVFCHYREEIDTIAALLRAGGIERVATFDGRTSKAKRFDILSDKNDVLILQIQTGCEGLNLQENYSEIYFVSPNWNPAVEDQAVARCHRFGQVKPVYVERFEMNSFNFGDVKNTRTLDNYVVDVQENKRLIAGEFID